MRHLVLWLTLIVTLTGCVPTTYYVVYDPPSDHPSVTVVPQVPDKPGVAFTRQVEIALLRLGIKVIQARKAPGTTRTMETSGGQTETRYAEGSWFDTRGADVVISTTAEGNNSLKILVGDTVLHVGVVPNAPDALQEHLCLLFRGLELVPTCDGVVRGGFKVEYETPSDAPDPGH